MWTRLWPSLAPRLGASDAIILESFPDRTATDLINALADADASPDEIEQTIIKND
ncbi:hypothetical protein [Microcoleus sp.]|uniref:hypothetical protein n=1 Tax=Microcoleus sp. TaxID=44472 RepID=UPI0035253677